MPNQDVPPTVRNGGVQTDAVGLFVRALRQVQQARLPVR